MKTRQSKPDESATLARVKGEVALHPLSFFFFPQSASVCGVCVCVPHASCAFPTHPGCARGARWLCSLWLPSSRARRRSRKRRARPTRDSSPRGRPTQTIRSVSSKPGQTTSEGTTTCATHFADFLNQEKDARLSSRLEPLRARAHSLRAFQSEIRARLPLSFSPHTHTHTGDAFPVTPLRRVPRIRPLSSVQTTVVN